MDNREIRGCAIISKGDVPTMVNQEEFLIPSQSGNGRYKVKHKQEWTCSCPDFRYRNNIKACKHIIATQFWLKMRNKVEVDDLDINEIVDREECPYCKSINIKKEGLRKNKSGSKQKYRCKDCKKHFVLDPIKYVKGNGKIVTLTMDLYFKGLSLRKIKDTIFQFYGLELHHETIRRWITKFTKLMNDHVAKLEPNVSKVWHSDEQMIKSKGEWKWAWNVIDDKTRFLLANNITEKREVGDARRVFQKAKSSAKEKPEIVITDGLQAYQKAFRKEFWQHTNPPQHIREIRFRDKIWNNNLIERYHGTWRERDKVMRGFKGQEQVIAEAFRTYYNFIRPHQGLNGLTPSQVAGINLGLRRNRWLDLLKMASLSNDKF